MSAPTPEASTPATGPVTRMELAISSILRGGILLSLTLVLTGVIIMYSRHPEYFSSAEPLAHLKVEGQHTPVTLRGVFAGVLAGRGRSVVMLGVFVLFLTPVLRVAVSVLGFALQKDWAFTVITSVVLGFLLLSLVLGKVA